MDWACPGELLCAVQVAERYVMEVSGKRRGWNAVLENSMGRTLTATHRAAMHHRMGQDDIDRSGIRFAAELRENIDQTLRVFRGMLVGILRHQRLSPNNPALRHKR